MVWLKREKYNIHKRPHHWNGPIQDMIIVCFSYGKPFEVIAMDLGV